MGLRDIEPSAASARAAWRKEYGVTRAATACRTGIYIVFPDSYSRSGRPNGYLALSKGIRKHNECYRRVPSGNGSTSIG